MKALLPLCLMLVLAACGSTESKPLRPLQDNFDAQVFDNGVEVFTYRVNYPQRLPEVRKGSTEREGRRSGKTNGQAMLRLDERLALALEQRDMCPQGYIVLERFVGAGRARIRGECK